MIGSQILNYQVKSLLGEGGMGIVYLAEHVKLGRKVAIKVLHAHLASNESIRNRFINEAKTMAELQHPNIVSLLDYHEDEFGLYLIMEYIDGKPLDEYIEQVSGPIPEETVILFFKQALSAFHYAHEKKVVHRDIKPSNLIITNEGKLKVLDFGIAKIVGNDNYKLTKTGAHTGSVYYMSPEQVKGLDVDFKSDIYSLGITLYQMLTGCNPYVDLTTEYAIFEQIVKVPLTDPRTKYPAVSEHMVQVINKSTQKNPLDRFNSCNDFSKSLDNKNADELLIKNKNLVTENPINDSYESVPPQKKKINQLAIALILFIGLGGIIIIKFKQDAGKLKQEEVSLPPPIFAPQDTSQLKK
jgi:serine/threonine protein kinase